MKNNSRIRETKNGTVKRCAKCNLWLPIDSFLQRWDGRLYSYCKECHNVYNQRHIIEQRRWLNLCKRCEVMKKTGMCADKCPE
jgi:hypothetical protein